MKTCPDCAEEVQDTARVCRYCGYRFAEPPAAEEARGVQSPPTSTDASPQAEPRARESAAIDEQSGPLRIVGQRAGGKLLLLEAGDGFGHRVLDTEGKVLRPPRRLQPTAVASWEPYVGKEQTRFPNADAVAEAFEVGVLDFANEREREQYRQQRESDKLDRSRGKRSAWDLLPELVGALEGMSRPTLAIVAGLILAAVIGIVFALNAGNASKDRTTYVQNYMNSEVGGFGGVTCSKISSSDYDCVENDLEGKPDYTNGGEWDVVVNPTTGDVSSYSRIR